jgi:predicted glutamine amidotransferase
MGGWAPGCTQLTFSLPSYCPWLSDRNNENLARLACKIVSPLIFAHVRAAYPGMPVSEQNCHPFAWGRYLWMHNGVVGGFAKVGCHRQ